MENEFLPEAVSVAEANKLIAQDPEVIVLDVREAEELEVCRLPDARHIPMNTVPECLDAIPRDRRILVLCHHGGRSMRVTRFLRSKGLGNVQNIHGGIDAWALEINPAMKRY